MLCVLHLIHSTDHLHTSRKPATPSGLCILRSFVWFMPCKSCIGQIDRLLVLQIHQARHTMPTYALSGKCCHFINKIHPSSGNRAASQQQWEKHLIHLFILHLFSLLWKLHFPARNTSTTNT